MKKEILELVRSVAEDIPDDTSVDLLEEGLIDSPIMVELIVAIEDKYEIEIDGDDINKENFNCIDSITELIKKYLS